MSEHQLVIRLVDDGHALFSIQCPHTGADRPCASWEHRGDDEPCICQCDACLEGGHDDCNSDYLEDIGRKWCDARPVNECWYQHAFGSDMLDFGHDGVQARIPVRLHGGSWEEPIEVTQIDAKVES